MDEKDLELLYPDSYGVIANDEQLNNVIEIEQ